MLAPGAWPLLGRTVLLPIDTALAGLVALITMALSRRHRRLGDLLGGTAVVRDRGRSAADGTGAPA